MTDRIVCADCNTELEHGSCPNPECPGGAITHADALLAAINRPNLIAKLRDERKQLADHLRTIASNGSDLCGHYDPLHDLADELDPGEA